MSHAYEQSSKSANPAKAPPRWQAQEISLSTSFEIISNVTITSFVTNAAIGKNLGSCQRLEVTTRDRHRPLFPTG